MPATLDRWIDAAPDDYRIEVTGAEYEDLIFGKPITRGSEQITLDDGPFRVVKPDQIEQSGDQELPRFADKSAEDREKPIDEA